MLLVSPLVGVAAVSVSVPAGGVAADAHDGIGSPRPAAIDPAGIAPLARAAPAGIAPPLAGRGAAAVTLAHHVALGLTGITESRVAGRLTRSAGIFKPHEIVDGPDGAMWFTDIRGPFGGGGSIDRFAIPGKAQARFP